MHKAWFFAAPDLKLRYGDNRPITLGETHEVDGAIVPCSNGLHASQDMSDAFFYAPGFDLFRVVLSGRVVNSADKLVASQRKYIAHLPKQHVIEAVKKAAFECIEYTLKDINTIDSDTAKRLRGHINQVINGEMTVQDIKFIYGPNKAFDTIYWYIIDNLEIMTALDCDRFYMVHRISGLMSRSSFFKICYENNILQSPHWTHAG